MTETDALKFKKICDLVLRESDAKFGIGTYMEKKLHRILKHYICENEADHEVPIGTYIADVFCGGDIFEIQTGSFYPMKNKIKFYLESTDYNITVVFPLAERKWVMWIDPVTSEITKKRCSPKHQTEISLLCEMFWLIPYLNNPRLSFMTVSMEIEEYRLLNGWSRDGKKGASRYEAIPTALISQTIFCSPDDFKRIIPSNLPRFFKASDFSKLVGLRGRKLYGALKVLEEIGLVARGEKEGKSYIYEYLAFEGK